MTMIMARSAVTSAACVIRAAVITATGAGVSRIMVITEDTMEINTDQIMIGEEWVFQMNTRTTAAVTIPAMKVQVMTGTARGEKMKVILQNTEVKEEEINRKVFMAAIPVTMEMQARVGLTVDGGTGPVMKYHPGSVMKMHNAAGALTK